MRILIVDQCSASKGVPDSTDCFDEHDIDEFGLQDLLDRAQVPAMKARDLYTGRQQELITRAVDRLRATGDDVDRVFISAGFGVVDEDDLLPPYDVTFTGRPQEEIIERTRRLCIEASLRELVSRTPPYDVVFFALGQDYYLGIDLPGLIDELGESTMVVLFNRELVAVRFDNVVSIHARTDEARENGAIVIALKGQFIKNFAEHRELGASISEPTDLIEYCTTEVTSQSDLEEFDG